MNHKTVGLLCQRVLQNHIMCPTCRDIALRCLLSISRLRQRAKGTSLQCAFSNTLPATYAEDYGSSEDSCMS
jgi:hypothetical protein